MNVSSTARRMLVITGLAVLATFLARASQRRAVRLDYDDGVYWQTALAVADGYQPYSDVFFAQPPLYAWLSALPFALDAGEVGSRLLTIGWALLLSTGAGVLGGLLAGRYAGMAAALLVALLPPVQRYCFQFGADLPTAALVTWSVVCAVRARPRWWLASGTLLGVAGVIKLITVVAIPALLVAALACRRRLAALASVSVSAVAVCALVLAVTSPPEQAWDQIVALHLTAADIQDQPVPGGTISMLTLWIVPFGLLSGAGTYLCLRRLPRDRRLPVVALVVWGTTGVVFAGLHRPIFEHHLLLFVASGAAITAAGFFAFLQPKAQVLTTAALALICVVQALMLPVSPRLESTAMLRCLRALPSGSVLVTDDQEIAARAGLRTPPWLADTSRVRISSGHLTTAEIIAGANGAVGVLFAPPDRAKFVDPAITAWARRAFPLTYAADGYLLAVSTPLDCAS
ncbi:glycosyltransferase family 39 protein [Micromonospora sp. NPDC049151]|uniref:ArnT family glycosyltransferase n=1 Tax=Micromonospora sp. NPDC049151 TaxID=3155648 RepID=UPI0033EC3F86